MSTKFVLSTGDMLVFVPQFGKATIPPLTAPIPLVGTGTELDILGMPVCVEGDEFPEALQSPLPYIAGDKVQPGAGLLEIKLDESHWTSTLLCNDKKVLRLGGTIEAKFQVTVPAMNPVYPSPIPDETTEYKGTAKYVSPKNFFFEGD